MKALFKRIVTSIIQYEARLVLKKYKPKIIVVVGSVGKTTTKDAVYHVLKKDYFVRKSDKSFNSEIGVPLTILGCRNAWLNPFLWLKNIIEGGILIFLKNDYPEWLVLEVGADHPGDIKAVAAWLSTDIVVLTRLPDVPVHVEYFDSPEDIVKEKAEIIASLKEGGTLVINGDDEKIRQLTARYGDKKIIRYGMEKENDVYASHYNPFSRNKVPVGIRFRLHDKKAETKMELSGVLGRAHIYPVLASAAVGHVLGLSQKKIAASFETYRAPCGRMRVIPGIKNTTLIDDTYNSSPVALDEALLLLETLHVPGRKIVVLGDMMELGKYSVEEHKRLGKKAGEVSDMLITVGFRARGFAEGALQSRMHGSKVLQYDDVERAGKELQNLLKEGDVVLFKASQSIRLEKAVLEVMAEPDRAPELLVRQERAWSKR